MKASFVSSLSVSQAMRYSTMRTQSDLAKALKEQDTGKVYDSGLALGARTAQTVTFARDLERLNGIVDSNGLVAARLKASQEALTNIYRRRAGVSAACSPPAPPAMRRLPSPGTAAASRSTR